MSGCGQYPSLFHKVATDKQEEANKKVLARLGAERNQNEIKPVVRISLSEVQNRVISQNQDIEIAYTKLYRTRQEITRSRMGFLPRISHLALAATASGGTGSIFFIASVLPTPTKWFDYKRTKLMASAEYYSWKAIRFNIQQDVAKLYFTIQLEEAILSIMQQELAILESVHNSTKTNQSLGSASQADVNEARRKVLQFENEIIDLKALIKGDKTGLKTIISWDSHQPLDLELIALDAKLQDLDIAEQTLIERAIAESPELKVFKYLGSAARYQSKSQKWSFLSFSGIGFDSMSRVRMSKAETKAMKERVGSTAKLIENQVVVGISDYKNQIEQFTMASQIMDLSWRSVQQARSLFASNDISFAEKSQLELDYLRDLRNAATAHQAIFMRLQDIERVSHVKLNNLQFRDEKKEAALKTEGNSFQVEVGKLGRAFLLPIIYLSIADHDQMGEVVSVTYILNDSTLAPRTVTNAESNFQWSFKSNISYTGQARIKFKNQQTIGVDFTVK